MALSAGHFLTNSWCRSAQPTVSSVVSRQLHLSCLGKQVECGPGSKPVSSLHPCSLRGMEDVSLWMLQSKSTTGRSGNWVFHVELPAPISHRFLESYWPFSPTEASKAAQDSPREHPYQHLQALSHPPPRGIFPSSCLELLSWLPSMTDYNLQADINPFLPHCFYDSNRKAI